MNRMLAQGKNNIWDGLSKFLYWYISTVDKKAEIIFMNYGFSKSNYKIELDERDEKNRYSVQLYDHIARSVDIKGKDILEVGSGRGGGLSYINRYLVPKSATGVDLCKKAIGFCNQHYAKEGIKFVHGNAQSLGFPDETFDVILNVESSHRYDDVDKFLSEVHRVLKPGGFFLFTDFRFENEMKDLDIQLKKSRLKLVKDELITAHVVEALEKSSEDRSALIQRFVPKFLHNTLKDFAGNEGSPTYNSFVNRELEYFHYVFVK